MSYRWLRGSTLKSLQLVSLIIQSIAVFNFEVIAVVVFFFASMSRTLLFAFWSHRPWSDHKLMPFWLKPVRPESDAMPAITSCQALCSTIVVFALFRGHNNSRQCDENIVLSFGQTKAVLQLNSVNILFVGSNDFQRHIDICLHPGYYALNIDLRHSFLPLLLISVANSLIISLGYGSKISVANEILQKLLGLAIVWRKVLINELLCHSMGGPAVEWSAGHSQCRSQGLPLYIIEVSKSH